MAFFGDVLGWKIENKFSEGKWEILLGVGWRSWWVLGHVLRLNLNLMNIKFDCKIIT